MFRRTLPRSRPLSIILLTLIVASWPHTARTQPPIPTIGGEIRLRAEGLDNALDLNKHQDDSYQFYRMRYRIWAEAKPRDGLRLYFRLGGESKWGVFQTDRSGSSISEQASIRDPESRVGLDNAWAELRLPWVQGLSFKFGRMDLFYGEGFLIADGTPADGSSSAFFDGMALSLKGEKRQTDLFMMKIQDDGFGTAARDENLYGLETRREGLEAYLLHRTKWGRTLNGPPPDSTRIMHPRQYTTCLGARYAHRPEAGWQLAAEGAVQAGKYFSDIRHVYSIVPAASAKSLEAYKTVYEPVNQIAFGGIIHGGWVSASPSKAGIEAGGLYLSGDDPGSGSIGGWDGFYSEWPKYSELLVYTLYDNTTRIRPDDPGTWTNLAAGWCEGRIKPAPVATLSLRLTRLYAPEVLPGGNGHRDRGLLTSGQCAFTFHPDLEGQLLGEYFVPGTFYSRWVGRKLRDADAAWYGRAQITARF